MADLTALGSEQGWFNDDGEGFDGYWQNLDDGELDRPGHKLALVRGMQAERLSMYAVSDFSTRPVLACEGGQPSGSFKGPTWSADGRALAWYEDDGVWTSPAPAELTAPGACAEFAPGLLIAGASQPRWGVADVLPAPATATEIATPTPTSTPIPTTTSTLLPSTTATSNPTSTSTASPSVTSSPTPSATPSPASSATTTVIPSRTPIISPSATPSPTPNATSTASPSGTVKQSPRETAPATPADTPTPTGTPSTTATATAEASPTVTETAATACVGDCTLDAQVTVDEALTMVLIALGSQDVGNCPPGDANTDGEITVDEIVAAVNNALSGC